MTGWYAAYTLAMYSGDTLAELNVRMAWLHWHEHWYWHEHWHDEDLEICDFVDHAEITLDTP